MMMRQRRQSLELADVRMKPALYAFLDNPPISAGTGGKGERPSFFTAGIGLGR